MTSPLSAETTPYSVAGEKRSVLAAGAMSVILSVLVVVAALAAVFSMMASAAAKKKADEVIAIKVQLERDVEEALKRKAALEQELQQLKHDLRDTKDENKALKKKRYEEKKSPPPAAAPVVMETTTSQAAAPSTNDAAERARLEKQWADAFAELTALKAKNATLEKELADVQQKAASRTAASESDKQTIAALREQIAVEKKRVGAEEKVIMDMRRKVEWHRRIHLVQQKELEKEQDKTAHIRQRFLDVCVDVVGLQKLLPNAVAPSLASEHSLREVERLQQEQTAYKAAQELEAKKEATAPRDDKSPAAAAN